MSWISVEKHIDLWNRLSPMPLIANEIKLTRSSSIEQKNNEKFINIVHIMALNINLKGLIFCSYDMYLNSDVIP